MFQSIDMRHPYDTYYATSYNCLWLYINPQQYTMNNTWTSMKMSVKRHEHFLDYVNLYC